MHDMPDCHAVHGEYGVRERDRLCLFWPRVLLLSNRLGWHGQHRGTTWELFDGMSNGSLRVRCRFVFEFGRSGVMHGCASGVLHHGWRSEECHWGDCLSSGQLQSTDESDVSVGMQGMSGWDVLPGDRQCGTDAMPGWHVLSVGKLVGVHDPLPERLVLTVGQPDDRHGDVHRVSDRHVLSGAGGGTDRLSGWLLLPNSERVAAGRVSDRDIQRDDQRNEQHDMYCLSDGYVRLVYGALRMLELWRKHVQQLDGTDGIECVRCLPCGHGDVWSRGSVDVSDGSDTGTILRVRDHLFIDHHLRE